MARRNLSRKLEGRKSVQKRWGKRTEKRSSAANAREARLTKKADAVASSSTAMEAEAVSDASIVAEAMVLVPEAMPPVPFPTTNDVQTQTDQEFSIERLCAELNAARQRITLLERKLRIKEEELASTRSRPESRTGREPRRALSLDQLMPSTRTRRAKNHRSQRQQTHEKGKNTTARTDLRNARHSVTLLMGLSWRQRELLKKIMINTTEAEEGGLDFLAATHEVRSLKKRLVSHARFEVHCDEFGRSTLLCANIREVLLHRVETLENGKLTENFDGKLLIAILGDRGCGSVKIGLQIGNLLSDVNSPRNFTAGCILRGSGNPIRDGEPPSTSSCSIGTAQRFFSGRVRPKIDYRVVSLRGHEFYLCLARTYGPCCCFSVRTVPRTVPSTWECNCLATDDPVNGARSNQARQDPGITGDHLRRLLRASEEIRSIGTLFASDIADLLNDVRELHTYARAVLMSPQQIHNFEAKCFAVHSYFRTLWESHPTELETDNASGFTPKLHWLLAHAPDFAKRWGWFGFLSEQSVEHLHHVLNKQGERFKHFKGDELLLKIGEHQTLLNAVFDRHLGW
uniref:Uncharacterized protein n=1 Tax=Globodera rostochiensis TaxID=31243 RepID=A0A914HUI7_GLORO